MLAFGINIESSPICQWREARKGKRDMIHSAIELIDDSTKVFFRHFRSQLEENMREKQFSENLSPRSGIFSPKLTPLTQLCHFCD
jgi:hypothetical protein